MADRRSEPKGRRGRESGRSRMGMSGRASGAAGRTARPPSRGLAHRSRRTAFAWRVSRRRRTRTSACRESRENGGHDAVGARGSWRRQAPTGRKSSSRDSGSRCPAAECRGSDKHQRRRAPPRLRHRGAHRNRSHTGHSAHRADRRAEAADTSRCPGHRPLPGRIVTRRKLGRHRGMAGRWRRRCCPARRRRHHRPLARG